MVNTTENTCISLECLNILAKLIFFASSSPKFLLASLTILLNLAKALPNPDGVFGDASEENTRQIHELIIGFLTLKHVFNLNNYQLGTPN